MKQDIIAAEPVRIVESQPLYQRQAQIVTRGVQGRYQRLRGWIAGPVLAGFFLLPWLTIDGRPVVLFDLPARQFHLAGMTLWPQDLWLLGWLLMLAAFALFTATTLIGRAWCGYTCPQTLWTQLFTMVERLTEGERHQRLRLARAPWSLHKLGRRTAKHALWLVLAGFTALTVVGYFNPITELVARFTSASELASWPMFWVLFLALATYVNAGWLREQVCLYMCPYARFQSAMIDDDTLTVTYDARRGEPRGGRRRDADHNTPELGDCVDCQVCVQVCPTGIDIRDGLQYECIGCARCIDGCDEIMARMGYAPGLIGYRSRKQSEGSASRLLRWRSLGYAGVTLGLCAAVVLGLLNRNPLAIDVLRDRGSLYRIDQSGLVINDYQLKIINKNNEPLRVSVALEGHETLRLLEPTAQRLLPTGLTELPLRIGAATTPSSVSAVNLSLCDLTSGRCASEPTYFFAPERTP